MSQLVALQPQLEWAGGISDDGAYGHGNDYHDAVGEAARRGAGVRARVANLNIFNRQSIARRFLLGHRGPPGDILPEPTRPRPLGRSSASRVNTVEVEDAGRQHGKDT